MSHIKTYARIKPSNNASQFYTKNDNTIRVNVRNIIIIIIIINKKTISYSMCIDIIHRIVLLYNFYNT